MKLTTSELVEVLKEKQYDIIYNSYTYMTNMPISQMTRDKI